MFRGSWELLSFRGGFRVVGFKVLGFVGGGVWFRALGRRLEWKVGNRMASGVDIWVYKAFFGSGGCAGC